jgi:hypothetical protein
MTAPRVLISLEPGMYAEVLAFSLRKQRPRANVSLIDPSEDLEAEARRVMPHLIVANRVPRAVREGAFWVEVELPVGGEGAAALGAEISADGYSGSVANVRTDHVLEALDRAEEQLIFGRGHAPDGCP